MRNESDFWLKALACSVKRVETNLYLSPQILVYTIDQTRSRSRPNHLVTVLMYEYPDLMHDTQFYFLQVILGSFFFTLNPSPLRIHRFLQIYDF